MKFNKVFMSVLACGLVLSGGALQAAASDEFWQALDCGDAVAVCRLLDAGRARVNAQDYAGQTPLHRAVATGNVPLVYLLLAGGADVVALDIAQRTPLHIVAKQGCPYVAHLLLAELGMNSEALGAPDSESETPLYKAAGRGNEEVARLLIEYGALVNGDQSEFGESPLHAAAGSGREAMVRLLLYHSANTEASNWCDGRPISNAVIKGHASVVRTLIDADSLLDRQNNQSFSPLDDAARHNRPEMAQLLVELGASVDGSPNLRQARCAVAQRFGERNVTLLPLRASCSKEIKGVPKPLLKDQRGLLRREWSQYRFQGSSLYDALLCVRAMRLEVIRNALDHLPTDLVGLIGQMALSDDEQRGLLMNGEEASVFEFDSPCSSSDAT